MSLLQLKVDPALKKAIEAKADEYGVPASSLARIALVNAFMKYDWCPPPAAPPMRDMTFEEYVSQTGGPRDISDQEYEQGMNDLGGVLSQAFRNKRLTPLEEQLRDL